MIVTALTSGRNGPSSRYRIRQFIQPLAARGIRLTEFFPGINKYTARHLWPLSHLTRLPGVLASQRAVLTIFERETFHGRCTLERFAGGKRLLDIDDALWLLNQTGFSEKLARECNGVIAGNDFIADYYRKYNANVWVLPTSVDTELWQPADRPKRSTWTIGWIGTSSNLGYLNLIEKPLADFFARHPKTELLIVCDRRPAFRLIPKSHVRFVRLTTKSEVQMVQEMDVGLMPLPDTDWGRGKCALKMLSYMAAGVPVVSTRVGVSALLLEQGAGIAAKTEGDWFEAFVQLFTRRNLALEFAAAGRKLVEERYSVNKNVAELAKIFFAVLKT